MNTKDLIRLGVPVGEPIRLAHEFIQNFIAQGKDGALLQAEILNIVANPPAFFADELRAPLARAIYRPAFTPRAELAPWASMGRGARSPGRETDGQCVCTAGRGGGRAHAGCARATACRSAACSRRTTR
ncbi:MAG: hypothetical protein M3463_17210 [Verrucomicrobiota bacterium]|nr:hypothetical protein [Verrucomicrobiota bacterium]